MKIEESKVIKLGLIELDRLDPVTVFLEDFSDGVGRITILCYGQAWSGFWGAMGENNTIVDFVLSCDEHYIAKKISDTPGDIIDYDKISDDIGCDVDRDSMGFCNKQLTEAYGNEWFMDLPLTGNPDYQYLCRIILAVQAGLKEYKNTLG